STDPDSAVYLFSGQFGGEPEILARAPGRVNLIGEHTDYNDGYVLPMAIDRDTIIAARPRRDGVLRIHAANFDATGEFPLGTWERSALYPWADYILGVAQQVEMLGRPLHDADCVLIGDVPIGAGLSSSASVEMAALALFEAIGGFTLESGEAASLGRRVENDFIGVASGIMDQFIVRAGRAGHALFLDCRSLHFDQIPIAMDDVLFIIADTKVARGLAGSAYNERVRECGEAVVFLNRATGKDTMRLRDFSIEELEGCRQSMPETIYRRARHVISENARTLDACDALRSGDATRLGDLLNRSDESLRADYEVTCPELDLMTSIGRALPGCYGSRMTGAGFGGCTVHLVSAASAEEFCAALHWEYAASTGIQSTPVPVAASAGANSTAL
ncbi:MAG: galactokinase, partial [Candidatus Hydrogenedentes bacterium]|nr:galactokinase [Candidatus Hydrogenedentota bacterium]